MRLGENRPVELYVRQGDTHLLKKEPMPNFTTVNSDEKSEELSKR